MGKTQIFFSLILSVLIFFLILVYYAYVVNKPCKHDLKPFDSSQRIHLTRQTIDRLQKSLQFKTVSYGPNDQNISAIKEYVNYVREEFNDIEKYPFVKLSLINQYSMLYKIDGSDQNLKPYLFAAHFDVVPAFAQNDNWTHDPFSAKIDDNFIYARGALDDKSSMLAQLEAVRIYFKKNGQPKRTLYLAYGHDEEISGHAGAELIASHLGNTQLEYVLDEGTMIIEGALKGLEKPIAYIANAEKGYLTVNFFVNVTGGHSSMPNSEESAIFILAEAISKLKANEVPSHLGNGPETDLLMNLALHLGFVERILLSNVWLFKPLIEYILSKLPTTNALIRTTTAVTIFKAGIKENVIPSYAEFVVNHRLHSLDSCEKILAHDLKIMNDKRINYKVLDCSEPSFISPSTSLGYTLIDHTTRQIFPDFATVPAIMVGLSDSRFYLNLTQNVYRYLPIHLKNEDLKRYHGVDERITIKNYEDLINFYYLLIKNTDEANLIKEKTHNEL